MLPSEFEAGRSYLGEVCVAHHIAAQSVDDNLANLARGQLGVSKNNRYLPSVTLSIELWIGRTEAIRKPLPEPAACNAHCILRHNIIVNPTLVLFHRLHPHALIVMGRRPIIKNQVFLLEVFMTMAVTDQSFARL